MGNRHHPSKFIYGCPEIWLDVSYVSDELIAHTAQLLDNVFFASVGLVAVAVDLSPAAIIHVATLTAINSRFEFFSPTSDKPQE
jgi:hypothetical protein